MDDFFLNFQCGTTAQTKFKCQVKYFIEFCFKIIVGIILALLVSIFVEIIFLWWTREFYNLLIGTMASDDNKVQYTLYRMRFVIKFDQSNWKQ